MISSCNWVDICHKLKFKLHNPAQESFKRYTSREMMGAMQPKIWLQFPGTRDIRYFRSNSFWLPDVHF